MKICKMNDKKVTFVKAARAMLGAERTTINRAEINAVLAENDLPNCSWLKSSRCGRPEVSTGCPPLMASMPLI